MHILKRFVDIPSSDPDDARKGKVLNILLLGTTVLIVVLMLVFLLIDIVQGERPWMGPMAGLSLLMIAGMAIFYLLNRRISGGFSRAAFLIFITILFTFSDTPVEVATGRTLFVFVLPIMMASVLLSPASSFLFSGLCAAIVCVLAFSIGQSPNLPAIFGYFLVALVSWLPARELEQTLAEVRQANAELDKRVAERTRELSESLARESQLAGQRQAILQAIADGVMVFDMRGIVIMANPAISRMIDIQLDQIIAHHHAEIFRSLPTGTDGRAALQQAMEQRDSGGPPLRIPWGEKTLSVSVAPVQETTGEITGSVAVFRDFTHEAEVEEMKNSFVAMVSHELRTPLNAVLGYSEMLRDSFYGPLNEKQTGAAGRIYKNSQRLLAIVSDLLDKAQLEAGYLNMEISPFQPAELIENLHGIMEKALEDKKLELITEVDPALPAEILGDPQRIQQVLLNLVNNAIKFTPSGAIQVKLYRAADEYWAFDVIDSGPGISADDQKIIFEPFRQAGKMITRGHGGIGLGLSIARRLVGLMGGRIFVKSVTGQGSTFSVILPFEPAKKGEEDAA